MTGCSDYICVSIWVCWWLEDVGPARISAHRPYGICLLLCNDMIIWHLLIVEAIMICIIMWYAFKISWYLASHASEFCWWQSIPSWDILQRFKIVPLSVRHWWWCKVFLLVGLNRSASMDILLLPHQVCVRSSSSAELIVFALFMGKFRLKIILHSFSLHGFFFPLGFFHARF